MTIDSADWHVRCDVEGPIGFITLDNPAKRNALGHKLLGDLMDALDALKDRRVRAVILRAKPDAKCWSAGHDIADIPRGGKDPLRHDEPLEEAIRTVRAFPAPIIAMVRGGVWGGAFDLVLSCDLVIADDTATFAITPANLGVPYSTTGLLHFIGRLQTNIVKEMFFTAKPVDAERAAQWGIVNHLVAHDSLEPFTVDMAQQIASKAPMAIAVVKEQLRILADYQPIASEIVARIQEARRTVYSSRDYEEGIQAFLEKRPPKFEGR